MLQTLGLGLAIVENDPERFFELMPAAVGVFELFGHSNYRNACTLFLLQWNLWKQNGHPAYVWLLDNFKACSEEYGESAIHRLMMHIREWDYREDNISRRWAESRTAAHCFQKLEVSATHRDTYVKWYTVLGPPDEIIRLTEEFDRLCVLADYQELEALVGSPGFSAESMRTDDLTFWTDLPLNLATSFEAASNRIQQLKGKLQRPIDPDAFRALDHDLLFN